MEMSGDEKNSEFGNTESNSARKKRDNQYVYWFFTYNGYDVEIMEIILSVLRGECDWFIIQEETGESGNKHLQGTLKLKKKKRRTELTRLVNGPHYEVTHKVTASACYCSNKDKRTGQIWTHNFTVPETITNTFEPYGWQLKVIDIVDGPVHPRLIHWFWEPFGGVGKSELAVWLYDKRQASICMGKANDIFHVLRKEINRRKIIVFDITKEKMEHFHYSTIEQIKNGFIVSGKYDSTHVRFDRPHIICFANTPPDKTKMTSNERWDIHEINI